MQIANLLSALIDVYMLILLARVLLSWVRVDPRNPVVGFIVGATEPLLAPIRNAIGIRARLDFSPMVLLLLLSVVRRWLI